MRGHRIILTPRTPFQNTHKSFICVHGLARLHRCLISRGAPTSAPAGPQRSTVAGRRSRRSGPARTQRGILRRLSARALVEARPGRAADPLDHITRTVQNMWIHLQTDVLFDISQFEQDAGVLLGADTKGSVAATCWAILCDGAEAFEETCTAIWPPGCNAAVHAPRTPRWSGTHCRLAAEHEVHLTVAGPRCNVAELEAHRSPGELLGAPTTVVDSSPRSKLVLYLSALHHHGPAVSRRRPALPPDQARRSCTPRRCQPNPRTGSHPCPRSDDAATCRCARANRASCSWGRSC